MSELNYIEIARDAGVPISPNSAIGYETQLVNLQTSQATFDTSWGEAKRLYREFLDKNDNAGVSTGKRRLALLLTKAMEKGWKVDGQLV